MISVFLFLVAIALATTHFFYKKTRRSTRFSELLLSYIVFFNIGLFSLLSAYAHLFRGPQTAQVIGWAAGSPFQFEVGIANLSYGVLGLLSCWKKDRFRDATLVGWSVLLLGAFVGHMIQAYTAGDRAPDNFGPFVWFNDLFLPPFLLSLLFFTKKKS